jgi:xanthine/CO dehydrogenase XdhC/CoxF family maturation factor
MQFLQPTAILQERGQSDCPYVFAIVRRGMFIRLRALAVQLFFGAPMVEIEAIVAATEALRRENRDAVLATVVRVRGSAYRRAGARMLLLPDGRRIGSISGGCLEGDISRKAWWLTSGGEPVVRVYDTTTDAGAGEDVAREFGVGCNGVVDVLLERISTDSVTQTLAFIKNCRESGEPGVIAHVIREAHIVSAHRFFTSCADRLCDTQSRETLLAAESRFVAADSAEIFYEYVAPRPELIIFGSGYDVAPVVQFAGALGWQVTVADSRPASAASRFPSARVLGFDKVRITERSAVVLMTHNYAQDRDILRNVLPAGARYVGLLGPRHRTERLFADLGISTDWESLHAPVGLDIGGDSPELIALSIISEIQAVLSGRNGGMLRARSGPVYQPMCELVS